MSKGQLISKILRAIEKNESPEDIEQMLNDLYISGYRLGYADGKEVGDFDDD